jgi:hypothetical protein
VATSSARIINICGLLRQMAIIITEAKGLLSRLLPLTSCEKMQNRRIHDVAGGIHRGVLAFD